MSVRAGVVGTGALGFHHARLLRRMPGVTFAGIYDKNPTRAAEVAKGYVKSIEGQKSGEVIEV